MDFVSLLEFPAGKVLDIHAILLSLQAACRAIVPTCSVAGQVPFSDKIAVSGGAGMSVVESSDLRFVYDGVTVSSNSKSSVGGGIYAEATTQFLFLSMVFFLNYVGTTCGAISLLLGRTASTAQATHHPATFSN